MGGMVAASQALNQMSPASIGFYVPPIVGPAITWHAKKIGAYFYFWITVNVFNGKCVTFHWLQIWPTYPAGYHNQGGTIPSAPKDTDPCENPIPGQGRAVTTYDWGLRVWPVHCLARIWTGKQETDSDVWLPTTTE